MLYRVELANRQTGESSTLEVTALSVADARLKAETHGQLVGAIRPVEPPTACPDGRTIRTGRLWLVLSLAMGVVAIGGAGAAIYLAVKMQADSTALLDSEASDRESLNARLQATERRLSTQVERSDSATVQSLMDQRRRLEASEQKLIEVERQIKLLADAARSKPADSPGAAKLRADIDRLEKERERLIREKAEKLKSRDDLLRQRNGGSPEIRGVLDKALDDFDAAIKETDGKIKDTETKIYELRQKMPDL